MAAKPGTMGAMARVGVDIGGSGIKGALIDTDSGELLSERVRRPTPRPATPEAVAQTLAEVVAACGGQGAVGVGFPAALRDGAPLTAINVDRAFLGTDLTRLFAERCGRPVVVLNDADAAGLAELTFGAARERRGVVLLITVGTGLGSALLVDGRLVANTELGQLPLHGEPAERWASAAARQRDGLKWPEWGARFDEYLQLVERLLYPELIVLGGGAVKKWECFAHVFTVEAEVLPARLGNLAGMVGAALHARRQGAGPGSGGRGPG